MLALALSLALLGAGPGRPPAVRVIFTADLGGRTRPSPDFDAPGLPLRQLGGWHGLVRTIDSLRTPATLLVDCGNFAFGSPEAESTDGRAAARFLSQLRYDAVAIGARDLVGGLPNLEYIAAGSAFALLGDPLLDVALGRQAPLFRPWKVFVAGGFRVAVVGLFDPDAGALYPADELRGIPVEPPLAQVARYLPLVRAESCDAVIVIGHIALEDGRAIADSFPELCAVLCRAGGPGGLLPARGGVAVAAPGVAGRRVGVLDVEFDPVTRRPARTTVTQVNVEPQPARGPLWGWVDELDRAEWSRPAGFARTGFRPWNGGEPELALAVTELARRQAGADIALVPPAAFDGGLAAGWFDRHALLSLAPWRDRLRLLSVNDSALALLALAPDVPPATPAPAIAGGDYFVTGTTEGWPRARDVVRIRVRNPHRGFYKVLVTDRWVRRTLLADRGRVLPQDLGALLAAALGTNETLSPAAPVQRLPATPGLVKAASDGLVNLNTADLAELCRLPGVGPKTAERIIEYRNSAGRFASVAELQNVKGIGPKKYAVLAPLVTVR